jgi:hypothetical protein
MERSILILSIPTHRTCHQNIGRQVALPPPINARCPQNHWMLLGLASIPFKHNKASDSMPWKVL